MTERERVADWLEQRAQAYLNDKKHLEKAGRPAGLSAAMAAELRQAALDVCQPLTDRTEESA